MSLRCVLKSRKRDPESGKTNNTSEYCRLLHDALVHLKGSGWNKEAAAACNDTGGLARLLSCTYEKAKENMKSVFFKRMGDPLRAHLCLKRPTPLARVYV